MAAGNTGVKRQRAYDAWNDARKNPKVSKETVDALKAELDVIDNQVEAETGERQAPTPFGF